VALQPSNAASWKELWRFHLNYTTDLKARERALDTAYYLNPWDPELARTSLKLAPVN